eukprot:2211576-Rhodomonas_salina.1
MQSGTIATMDRRIRLYHRRVGTITATSDENGSSGKLSDPIGLGACYAMPGGTAEHVDGTGYALATPCPVSPYALTSRCPVLRCSKLCPALKASIFSSRCLLPT